VAFDAAYLAMEDKAAPKEVPHPRVAETARVLLEGLVRDWQRLRDGAGLPALGEPPTCDWCDARGLCRRDHWSPTADAATADNPSGGAGR
jgi:ATP-dependent helicase/nuclease subunit B